MAGQYTDGETGLIYLRARYYDPGTGVFLTRDPLEAQTREPYGYVGGNPLNATDPTGLYWGQGVVENVVEAVGDTGEFVWRNRDTIGTGIGVAACFSPVAAVCAGGLAVGFAGRASKRVEEHGFGRSLGENVGDLTLTAGTFGLVRLPGKYLLGGELSLFSSGSSWSLGQRLATAALRAEVGVSQFVGRYLVEHQEPC